MGNSGDEPEATPDSSESRLDRSSGLLARHVAGDSNAFPELVQLYRSRIYGYLVYCGVDSDHRDDLFQEILLRVHKGARRFDTSLAFEPWLFTIATNAIRNHRKSTIARVLLNGGDEHENVIDTPSTDPSSMDRTIGSETAHWLVEAMTALPEEQREAMTLCCIRGMSHEDAAIALGFPANTVKTYVRRGRMALAKRLAARNALINREVKR